LFLSLTRPLATSRVAGEGLATSCHGDRNIRKRALAVYGRVETERGPRSSVPFFRPVLPSRSSVPFFRPVLPSRSSVPFFRPVLPSRSSFRPVPVRSALQSRPVPVRSAPFFRYSVPFLRSSVPFFRPVLPSRSSVPFFLPSRSSPLRSSVPSRSSPLRSVLPLFRPVPPFFRPVPHFKSPNSARSRARHGKVGTHTATQT
jgi:hypothetical protein